jgi:hypothetical protein
MRNIEKRITALEKAHALQVAKPTKRLAPEWLLDAWHEDSGLPFDTDELALESLLRMWEPLFLQRGNPDSDFVPISTRKSQTG